MASVKSQQLPSFAQTFNIASTSSASAESNALPPIQANHDSPHSHHEPSRKRPRYDSAASSKSRVKQEDVDEQDYDMLEPSPPPPPEGPPPHPHSAGTTRKRRIIHTQTQSTHGNTANVSSPRLAFASDEIQKLRGNLKTVKDQQQQQHQQQQQQHHQQQQHQQQRELIDQRRGSVPGIVTLPSQSSNSRNNNHFRTSPNLAVRRDIGPPSSPRPHPRVVPSQLDHSNGKQQQQQQQQQQQHALPPPPISFAHRRSKHHPGSGKKKPADILISPLEAVPRDQFQLSIQSAPPIPRARGEVAGKFPMALPRIPVIHNNNRGVGGNRSIPSDHRFRPPGRVPPTPTRFTVHSQGTTSTTTTTGTGATTTAPTIPTTSRSSPPTASIPISSIRVPTTPNIFTQPNNYASSSSSSSSSEKKSAFIAPFEMFYDSLNDARQLKQWLHEQITKSQTLNQGLVSQQEQMGEVVEGLVERKLGGMRLEILGLQKKVEELEGALRVVNGGDRSVRSSKPHGGPSESYSFPPMNNRLGPPHLPLIVPLSPPPPPPMGGHWPQPPRADSCSPIPFEPRRLSVSAVRLEGGPLPPTQQRAEVEVGVGSQPEQDVKSSSSSSLSNNNKGLESPSPHAEEGGGGGEE